MRDSHQLSVIIHTGDTFTNSRFNCRPKMTKPLLYSRYDIEENRVTDFVLTVLQSLSVRRMEHLLSALLRNDERLILFDQQIQHGKGSVPDGSISASFRILIETKIRPNSVGIDQLRNHLELLSDNGSLHSHLLVLTPDHVEPEACAILCKAGKPVVWSSFDDFSRAIDELLGDPSDPAMDREVFLLRELQAMFRRLNLVASSSEVLIVAARSAWPEYEKYSAYVCQPDRPFKNVQHMGFYFNKAIQRVLPRIETVEDAISLERVEFRRGIHSGRLGELVEKMLADKVRNEGETYKVLLLTGESDARTVTLPANISNDLASDSGRRIAYVVGHRYARMESLKQARTTSDLEYP